MLPKSETRFIFKRIGNYSMGQANFSTDECCVCEQPRWADVLVQPNPNVKEFICTECLVRGYHAVRGLMAINKDDLERLLQIFCDEENQPHQFVGQRDKADEVIDQYFFEIK